MFDVFMLRFNWLTFVPPVLFVLLVVAEPISQHWPGAGLFVYGVIVVLAAGTALVVRGDRGFIGWGVFGSLAIFLLMLAGYIVGSGEFMRYWNRQYGGFVSHGDDYWQWAAYGVSWFLDNALANYGQIYGRDISDIRPSTGAARNLVFVYNLVLEVLIFATIATLVYNLRFELRPKKR